MAQLKSTTVQGSLRVTDTTYTTAAQLSILNAPTSSNGTTFGPGTADYVLMSNGASVYWGTGATNALKALDVSTIGNTDGTKYIAAISQADGKISATAIDVATTYSATGTTAISGTGVAAAIGTLDVTSVGDDTSYISAISETDGKISATSQSIQSTYSSTGTLAINGTGVADALATLDSTLPSGSATSKTLTALTITDGKMTAATFSNIAIGAGQVTSGTLSVARGGTGIATATYKNAIIAGNASTVTNAFQTIRTNNGAFYATAQDGAPSFGTLPIAQGGTGITTTDPHKVLIGPSSGTTAAAPTWRTIIADDLPTATTSAFGVTKLSNTSSSTEEGLAATPKGVWAAINTLDGNLNSTTPGAGKTLTAFSQTNGKVSATFGNISITASQAGLGNVSNNANLNGATGAKGDIIYWSAADTPSHLTNTSSTTKKFLSITSQVPAWTTLSKSDVGLENVTNDAQVKASLGTAQGDMLYWSAASTPARLAKGSANTILTASGTNQNPAWTGTAATITSATSTTANTAAYANLTLGNSTNVTSTTAHSEGQIILYSAATAAHTLKGASTTTAYTSTLPNNTGVLVSLSSGTAKGSSTKPIYVPATGIVTECSTYAGGTKVTFNGEDKGESTASFYAPTSAGTSGQYLKSSGSGAPTWDDPKVSISANVTTNAQYAIPFVTTGNNGTSPTAAKIEGLQKNTTKLYFNPSSGRLTATTVANAIWNDYAECRSALVEEPGRVITESKDGKMRLTEERLMPACKIISDTYGTIMGQSKEARTPIAVAGRVLAYPYQNKEVYELGAAVCSAPNGTVDIMTRDEIREYPERILGTVSEIPNYDIWLAGNENNPKHIPINGRIWIYVR